MEYLWWFPISWTPLSPEEDTSPSRVLVTICNCKQHPSFPGVLWKSSWDCAPKNTPLSQENWNMHAAPLCPLIRVGAGDGQCLQLTMYLCLLCHHWQAAEKMRKEMTQRFEETIGAMEAENAEETEELREAHQVHIEVSLREKINTSYEAFRLTTEYGKPKVNKITLWGLHSCVVMIVWEGIMSKGQHRNRLVWGRRSTPHMRLSALPLSMASQR